MPVGFIQLLKLNAQTQYKVQKSRGYAPGLVWVKYNQKLAFQLRDMIPGIIFLATLVDTIDPPSFLL